MTSEEVAEIFHVDPVTIRRIVNKGDLAAYRIASDYRFAPSDIEEYLRKQRIGQPLKKEAEGTFVLDQLTQWILNALKGKYVTPIEVVNRFNRFTPPARMVLTRAHEEAQRFQHKFVGTEHILLGLMDEETDLCAQILRDVNTEPGEVRKVVEEIMSKGKRLVPEEQTSTGVIALTGRAKKVIELSVDEARRFNRQMVDSEHLLIGLLRENGGIAAGVLMALGVTVEGARTHLYFQAEENKADIVPVIPPEAASLPIEEGQGSVCSRCGAMCPRYFHFCFNCGQPIE